MVCVCLAVLKDPFDSKNQAKKDYNLNCIGRLENYNKETKKISLDKIYILQDTNKIQEGRFGFLPPLLDYFLNNISNNKVSIKNHYLVNTNTSYYFKYGIKTSDYPFLEALSSIYNIIQMI